MINLLRTLLNTFKARKVLYLLPVIAITLFLVDIHWVLLGILFYFPCFRWYTLTYHEYQAHKVIKPKNSVVEWIGYFILAVWEMQAPDRKINFHQIHHDNFKSPENDPTHAKLLKAKNSLQYCLDMSPHVPIPLYDATPEAVITPTYVWFNKNWERVMAVTLISWLVLLPFWTFLVFYCVPVFVWTIVFRTTDWNFHRMEYGDIPATCLYLGTSAYHNRHHHGEVYSRDTYYGIGFWKYLNIDYYITALFFKTY